MIGTDFWLNAFLQHCLPAACILFHVNDSHYLDLYFESLLYCVNWNLMRKPHPCFCRVTGSQEKVFVFLFDFNIRSTSDVDFGLIVWTVKGCGRLLSPVRELSAFSAFVNNKHASNFSHFPIIFFFLLLVDRLSGASLENVLFQQHIMHHTFKRSWFTTIIWYPRKHYHNHTPSTLTWPPSSQPLHIMLRRVCLFVCAPHLCVCSGIALPLDGPCAFGFSHPINLLITFKRLAN